MTTGAFLLRKLLGEVAGKRVLELGCGDGARAVELARAGATVLAVDPAPDAIAHARALAEASEVRMELHIGDFADLASWRGDSVDVAFAEGSLGELSDLGRVFRQVHRVLRAGAWFAFSLPHPFGFCVDAEPEPEGSLPLARPYLARSYFDSDAVDGRFPHQITSVFAALNRAGFRVDTISEPEPAASARGRALVPTAIIWRARKVGS